MRYANLSRILVSSILLLATTAWSGDKEGNGGDGAQILSTGEVISFDLWERGNEYLAPEVGLQLPGPVFKRILEEVPAAKNAFVPLRRIPVSDPDIGEIVFIPHWAFDQLYYDLLVRIEEILADPSIPIQQQRMISSSYGTLRLLDRPESSDRTSRALRREIRKRVFFRTFEDDARESYLKDFLAERLVQMPPAVTEAFLRELKKLQWRKARGPLLENEDTRPIFLADNIKRIPCALQKHGIIFYDPACIDRMSPTTRAALVVHEVAYRLFLLENPDQRDSFQVRTLTNALLQGANAVIDFEELGYPKLKQRNDALLALMKKHGLNSQFYPYSIRCTTPVGSPHQLATKLTLYPFRDLKGQLTIDGTQIEIEKEYPRPIPPHKPILEHYYAEVPQPDAENETVDLAVDTTSTEGFRLEMRLDLRNKRLQAKVSQGLYVRSTPLFEAELECKREN